MKSLCVSIRELNPSLTKKLEHVLIAKVVPTFAEHAPRKIHKN
jgi:hypothetical protein